MWNNRSTYFTGNEPSEKRYLLISVILTILFISIILFSICGNILVTIAICCDSHLRQLCNSLYVSLAIADLLVSVLVMTLSTLDFVLNKWILGYEMCLIYISFDIMCSTASILNILATAVDRYIHIHNPFHYSQFVTKFKVVLVIAFIWMLSGLMSFIPIHLKWHLSNSTVETNPHICMMKLNSRYAISSSFISFYLPCIVMVTLYIKLYRFARFHMLKTKLPTNASPVNNNSFRHFSDKLITPHNNNNKVDSNSTKMLQKKFKTDQKAAVTLGVIMGTFLMCWLPFFLLNCINPICNCVPDNLFFAATWLGYLNSCLNPVIYPMFNSDFKRAYRKIIQPLIAMSHCRAVFNEEPVRTTSRIKLEYSQVSSNGGTPSQLVTNKRFNNALGETEEQYIELSYSNINRRSELERFQPVSKKYKQMLSHSCSLDVNRIICNKEKHLSSSIQLDQLHDQEPPMSIIIINNSEDA